MLRAAPRRARAKRECQGSARGRPAPPGGVPSGVNGRRPPVVHAAMRARRVARVRLGSRSRVGVSDRYLRAVRAPQGSQLCLAAAQRVCVDGRHPQRHRAERRPAAASSAAVPACAGRSAWCVVRSAWRVARMHAHVCGRAIAARARGRGRARARSWCAASAAGVPAKLATRRALAQLCHAAQPLARGGAMHAAMHARLRAATVPRGATSVGATS